MKIEGQVWLLAMGFVTLLMGTGCSTEQATKQTVSTPVPGMIQVLNTEKPVIEKMEDKTSTHGSFVFNENLQPVFFEISQSQPSPMATETLKKNVEWLQKNPPFLVEVAGYTDSRGSTKRNRTLAERRAMKVRDFYVGAGIPKDRIAVIIMGQETPSCSEVTEECLMKSRRAETLIENKPLVSR